MSIEEPPRSQLNALVLPSNGGRRLLRNRVRYWIYQDMLNQLNSVIVSAEELDSLLNEAENLEAEGCGTEGGGLFLVAQRYRGFGLLQFTRGLRRSRSWPLRLRRGPGVYRHSPMAQSQLEAR